MKHFLLFIFSIITFTGVLSQASALCNDQDLRAVRLESQINHSDLETHDIYQIFHQSKQPTSSHESSTFHHCHLGHCSYILTPAIVFSSFASTQSMELMDPSVVIFNFHSQLFRPPIV